MSHAPLRMVAEPKMTFRERYAGEQMAGAAQRFIQADGNPPQYRHPTVGVRKNLRFVGN